VYSISPAMRPPEFQSDLRLCILTHYRLHVILQFISQLPNLFIGTPRICNFISLLIVWVRSFSKMLPSVKFAEDKVLVFVILR